MKKILKFTGIGLAVIAVILLLIIGYAYGRKYVARTGNLPEGTQLVLVDTNDKPSQSAFFSQTLPNLGWPVPQAYQKYIENFDWWQINFQQLLLTGEAIRENKPTSAVVFDLPEEEIPALASFAGKIKIVSMTKSGDGPEIAEVELSNGEYVGRYEYVLGSTVKEGVTVQQDDTIGTIVLAPRAVFPKENLGPWKKRDAVGDFNFKFSLFKIVEGEKQEPVWITTKSFVR